MITHIRAKNFKSWADSGEVQLAPLTGFFGTNSSGKSSLLQLLLLLKQTIGSDDVLFFGDEQSLVNLGSFRDVIHGHDTDKTLALEFGCKPRQPLKISVPDVNANGQPDVLSGPIGSLTFTTSIREEREKLSSEVLGAPTAAFENQFSRVYYLGPTRVHPQRHYHWNGKHPVEMGLCGDEAIAALLSARVRNLKTSHNGNGVPIEARVSAWLQKMELAHDFWLGPNGASDNSTYEVRIQKTPTSARVTLADIGYGLADLLPILVHCYYVPEGSTLILEQPGIHLHPHTQAQLADLFLEVIAERHLQILIESHSEQLLTRLQRRIAEKKVAQDTIALYFCRNTDGASTIEKLEVDELGDIHNWPEYFFGDVIGDMFAVTDVQIERLQSQQEASG
ncbi:hypothetical protein C6495_02945 [Candidatus Poribacteria bacterium]|nr:MAG: hypothetical protein C6495_02945 [Candidatus Poribacteria bacterium]